MNFFTKKNFKFKLIVCLCLFFALTNVLGLSKVYAESESGGGGILIKPICKLLVSLGDGIMSILQKAIMGTDATLQLDNSDPNWWETLVKWVVAIIVLAVIAFVITCIPGGWAAVGAALLKVGSYIALRGVVPLLIAGITFTGIAGKEGVEAVKTTVTAVSSEVLSEMVYLPTFSIGPAEIFSGKILLFDANIFNPKNVRMETVNDGSGNEITKYYYVENGERIYTSKNNTAQELKDIISKWYYIVRNIALVGSMITLLYVGIRMMLSSIAEEKAKYKQMLSDWVIAICLIVLMHYIMIFAHTLTESIVKVLNNISDDGVYIGIINKPGDNLKDSITKLQEATANNGVQYLSDDGTYISWPTNMMGMYRIAAQAVGNTSMDYIGHTLAYLALVIFTLAFSFTYIKRTLWLLFLTIISPFVALTYPLDKINDGKAQAFDMWLKEYIFNLLIQPFHLLLYTIFVTMSFELSSTNIIYSLVVLGFMMPAEKFLRTMFGFNKASSPGMLNGATGAALTMSAMGALKRFGDGKRGGPDGRGADGKGQGKENNKNIRTHDPDKTMDELLRSQKRSQKTTQKTTQNDNGEGGNTSNNIPTGDEAGTDSGQYQQDGSNTNADGQNHNPSTDETYDPSSELNPAEESPVDLTGSSRNSKFREALGMVRGKAEELQNSKVGRVTAGLGTTGWKYVVKPLSGKFIRTAANVLTESTFAGIGVASTIASGNVNDLGKNVGMGFSIGNSLSNGVVNRISRGINSKDNELGEFVNDAIDNYNRSFYRENYDQYLREQQDKKHRKDREKRELYRNELGLGSKEEIEQAMKAAEEYRKYGLGDADDELIIKAMQVENGNANNWASKDRILAAWYAKGTKTGKDLDEHMKSYKERTNAAESDIKRMRAMVRKINNM